MKPHKMKKFKHRVEFRKAHYGLDVQQMHTMAQSLAQQIAHDPVKLKAFIVATSIALGLPEVEE